METEYHAGFMKPKPRWFETLALMRVQMLAFLTDFLLLFYFLIIVSFCVSRGATGTGAFLLIPWWLALTLVFEGALLWQCFGESIGMRLLHLKLTGPRLGLARGALRLLSWHLSILTVAGLFAPLWDKKQLAWHDRLSGTVSRRVEPEAAAHVAWHRTSWGVALVLIIASTLTAGVFLTEINLGALFTGAGKSGLVWRGLFSPDWSELGGGLLLLIETIFMALMATLFAIVVAVPLSFLAARNLARGVVGRGVYTILRVFLSIIRSIEPIVWAIVFVVIVTPRRAAFAGVLALWVHSIADLTKLYSERLESIDYGPVEAVTATGASRLQVIQYGIVPQIVNPYISFTLYRWDINVRMATIIGVVGGGGIGQMLYQYTRLWYWERASVLILLIIGTVWLMDYTSSKLRARFESGGGGATPPELIRFAQEQSERK
jgi:phosphonate transport system permease protein